LWPIFFFHVRFHPLNLLDGLLCNEDHDVGLPATTAHGRGPTALACCARPAKRAAPARVSGSAAPDETSRVRALAGTGGQPRLEQGARSDAAGCAGKRVGTSV
jgi:hypothetical protein